MSDISLKNYIHVHQNFISNDYSSLSFDPQPIHLIKTSVDSYQVFGGVLHGVAVEAIKKITSDNLSSVYTTFYNKCNPSHTVDIEVTLVVEKKSFSMYSVKMTQDENLIAISQVIVSQFDSPSNQDKFKINIPDGFPDVYNWLWDTDNVNIFTVLKSQISLIHGAINWFDGYKTDQSVLAVLSDYASITLVQFLSQMPKTITIHSQFFGSVDSQKVLGKTEILGFSPGSVSVRFNQHDLNGIPLCSTTLSCALLPLDSGMMNHFNSNYIS